MDSSYVGRLDSSQESPDPDDGGERKCGKFFSERKDSEFEKTAEQAPADEPEEKNDEDT